MDRQFVYPGAIPLDTDLLNIQRNTMIALGYLAQATLGTGTWVDGLACTQQSVANMTVQIAPGSLVSLQNIDATAFGSLASDSTDPLVKMAISSTIVQSAALGTISAPGTTGQSINYLIEAGFTETDTTPVVLPYYNSSNPAAPYSGPSNSGTPQNTQRLQKISFQLKAGTAATTGTQSTPAVDSGYVGLWVITVAYAQSTITNANIALYPTSPFIGTKITGMRRKLTGNTTLYVNGTTGSDSNNGLTAATAWQTLQGAWNNLLTNFDCAGYAVTISVADGTYAGAFLTGSPVGLGGQAISFVGNVTTPANCTINAVNSSCIIVNCGSVVNLSGFKFQASGTGTNQGFGVYASTTGSLIQITGNCNFGACAVAHFSTGAAGQIVLGANYTISGNAPAHWQINAGGYIGGSGLTITLSGTPAFSAAFVTATGSGANLSTSAMTYSGSATGIRYTATFGAYINTTTAGNTTAIPGNAAGSSTGAYYN